MSGPSVLRRFAASMSIDADPGSAAGEVIGGVLEQLGGCAPDLAVLFISGPHIEHGDDLVDAVKATLSPGVTVAVSAAGVLGGAREAESGPGLSLWAGLTGEVQPVRLEAFDRTTLLGLPDDLRSGETMLLIADPFSFPVDEFFEVLPAGVTVVGGLASAAGEPGGNRLWIDGVEHRNGAVGVRFAPGVVTPVVSQGCRPIGEPWVVTRSEQQLIHELAGRPAVDRLNELIADLSPEDRLAASRGLHIGVVANDHREEFTQGDFLIRAVLGVEQTTNAVAAGDVVEVGQVVQFQVRDPASASADLATMVASGPVQLDGALVFTCNGRGTHLFGEAHHDAGVISEFLDGGVAGMFCAGEIGPVGERNALHGFTATVLGFGQLP